MNIGIPQPRWALELVGYTLFLLCVAFPMVRPVLEIKAGLFLLLLFGLLLHMLETRRIDIQPQVALWLLVTITIGALSSLHGAAMGAPGAWVYGFAIYVAWVAIHGLLLHGIDQKQVLRLYWIAVGSTIFISLNGLLFVISQIVLEQPIDVTSFLGWNTQDDLQAFGTAGGYIKINVIGINSMPFLVPMVFTGVLMMNHPQGQWRNVKRFANWAALLLGLLFVFIAGRRALIVVTLLTPLLVLLVWRVSGPTTAGRSLGSAAVLLLAGGLVFVFAATLNDLTGDPFALAQILLSVFEFSGSDESESGRREQFFALLNGWLERPLTGWGLGSSAGMFGSVRSPEYPWAYELYYLALLYQVGLVGMTLYAAFVAWIYVMTFRIVRSAHNLATPMAPFLTGMTAFLIASGTNPYLPRFDGLWIFLLSLACINIWLREAAVKLSGSTSSGMGLSTPAR